VYGVWNESDAYARKRLPEHGAVAAYCGYFLCNMSCSYLFLCRTMVDAAAPLSRDGLGLFSLSLGLTCVGVQHIRAAWTVHLAGLSGISVTIRRCLAIRFL